MAQRNPLNMALSGGFGAIGDLASQSLAQDQKRKLANEASQRETFRELLKDYTDKVMSGKLEPEQAEQALGAQGFPVQPGYFHTLQPSIESGLNSIVGEIGKAKGYNEVPGPKMMDSQLPKRLGPSVDVFGPNMKTLGTGDPTDLPSTPTGNVSTPEFQRLLSIADEKKSSFAPERVDNYDPKSATQQTSFVSADPTKLTGRNFQTAPNPTQKGENEGNTIVSDLKTKLAGGAGTLQGGIDTQQENASRGAKVKTAAATTAATTQAGLDVTTAPGNVTKEADRAGKLAYASKFAQDQATIAGVDPNIAKTFIHATATNRPYAYIPTGTDPTSHKVALAQFGKASVPVVSDKAQYEALVQIDAARADLDTMIQSLTSKLPKGPDGRIISAPANTLKVYMQTDPTLAGLVANFGMKVRGLRAQLGTVPGFRMTQAEINQWNNAEPNERDTFPTMIAKAYIQTQAMMHSEDSILGPQKPR